MSMFLVIAAPLVAACPMFVTPQMAKNNIIYRIKNHSGEWRRVMMSLGAAAAHEGRIDSKAT
jgi:hypothetical protein